MRLLLKLIFALSVLAGVILGLWASKAKAVIAPYNQSDYSDDIIKDNAIQRPVQATLRNTPTENVSNGQRQIANTNGFHSTRAENYEDRTYTKEEVIQLIKDYSQLYGISPLLPLRVANCESGYNQFSKNRYSSASGVFQYIHSTWIHTESGLLGISPFDADANVHMAIKSIASGGISNWSASAHCWKQ